MKKKNLTLVASLLMAGISVQPIFAAHASGSAPRIRLVGNKFNGVDITTAQKIVLENLINLPLAAAFASALDTANNTLEKFQKQTKLAKGFGNANAFGTQAATFQGFQNYKLFAVSTGFVLGVQAPSFDPSVYSKIGKTIADEADVYAGVGVGFTMMNVGMNLKMLVPGLYGNIKFGSYKSPDIGDGDSKFSSKSSSFGIGANYTLVKDQTFALIMKWRGVSVGTGFYYASNKVTLGVPLDSIVTPVPLNSDPSLSAVFPTNPNIVLNPSMKFGLEMSTYTIPFDISTSVCLAWFLNLNAGAGFDLNFGSSNIIIAGGSDVGVSGISSSEVTVDKGDFAIDGSTKNVGPSIADFRLMTGIGLNVWVLKIDVPFIYYIPSGLAFGLTAGVVF